MEWDWGMPWYRPTRITIARAGSDAGWRSGTGVWPSYYLIAFLQRFDIGVGSPTGVSNAIGAKFPAKYQRAIIHLRLDLRAINAVHLTPKGSSDTATYENVVAPLGLVKKDASQKKPLNLTDVVVGGDGSHVFHHWWTQYTQAALYRLTYIGKESTDPIKPRKKVRKNANYVNRSKRFTVKKTRKPLTAAWPHLNSERPVLRYAAVLLSSSNSGFLERKSLERKEPQRCHSRVIGIGSLRRAQETQPEILAALPTSR